MTQLQPSRCQPADYQRAIYAITPEAGTPFEALLIPKYWAHVSLSFRPGTHLEIYPPEGQYYAELLVQDCARLWAKVVVLRKIEFTAVEVGKEDLDLTDYEVAFGGVSLQYCVYRLVGKGKKDRLKAECGTKEDAEAWLRQHVRTLAGGQRTAAA